MTSKIRIDISRILYIQKEVVSYPDLPSESGERYVAHLVMFDHYNGVQLTKEQFDNLNLELDKYRESLRPIDEKIRELQSQYRLPKEVWI